MIVNFRVHSHIHNFTNRISKIKKYIYKKGKQRCGIKYHYHNLPYPLLIEQKSLLPLAHRMKMCFIQKSEVVTL